MASPIKFQYSLSDSSHVSDLSDEEGNNIPPGNKDPPPAKPPAKKNPPDPRRAALKVILDKKTPFQKEAKISKCMAFMRLDLTALHKCRFRDYLVKLGMRLRLSGGSASSISKNWNIAYMTPILVDIHFNWKRLKRDYANFRAELRKSNRAKPPPPVAATKFLDALEKEFDAAIDRHIAATEAAEAKKARNQEKKAVSFYKNKGERPQDEIPFDVTKADSKFCPGCKHMMVMPIESKQEVAEYNKEVEEDYQRRMKQHNALPVAVQRNKTRPRRGKMKERTFACYCFKMHCMMQDTGGNCVRCRAYKERGRIFLDEAGESCCCRICDCNCKLLFTETTRHTVARDADPLELPEKDAPQTMAGFVDYVHQTVAESHREELRSNPTASKQEISRNACTNSLYSIVSNPNLASARFQKKIKEAAGPMKKTSIHGKTIQQLRTEKKGRAAAEDSRYHRNRLMEGAPGMDESRFLSNGSKKKNQNPPAVPTETPEDFNGASAHQPITIDTDGESKQNPRQLLTTPSVPPVPPAAKQETPAAIQNVRGSACVQADEEDTTPASANILDLIAENLSSKNNSKLSIGIKERVVNLDREGKSTEQITTNMVRWYKRRKRQQEEQEKK